MFRWLQLLGLLSSSFRCVHLPSGVGRSGVLCDDGTLSQFGVEVYFVLSLFEQLPLNWGLSLVARVLWLV